ncbi:hypothetical protein ORS3428_30630 [Mesorhizobium sp. ORS 3428]|nr:hypothetical protein ORS3428_30645 [Mesorhizobium sp. ORS 3428]OHV89433.1 hypothetical protein ORS3428_30630 [Mesorhizobium sp. ORS 3428]
MWLRPTASSESIVPIGRWTAQVLRLFQVKNSAAQPEDPNLHFLDMHVERTYVRTNIGQTV